jgi:threonine dehydratase
MTVNFNDIEAAAELINGVVKQTPIVSSRLLNQWLGHEILFKAECLQTTGAFKLRGATNFVRKHLTKAKTLPSKIIANSSGNHAQAVAYTGAKAKIPVSIYASNTISPIKAAATKHYGAALHLFDNRVMADDAIADEARADKQCIWIPPFNHPDIIAGQGTAAFEALHQCTDIDAVFVPCGGGGLSAGTLIATRQLAPKAQVIAAEPLAANDAAQSLREGKIVSLKATPITLADGAATPSVGDLTFGFLQQLDDLVEVDEDTIIYWTQWLHHLLKLHIEPTCAMTMHATTSWLASQRTPKRVLVVLSGGNISTQTMQKVWKKDYLTRIPTLHA